MRQATQKKKTSARVSIRRDELALAAATLEILAQRMTQSFHMKAELKIPGQASN